MAQLIKAADWQDQDGMDTTRRFERTLEDAFGPYQRGNLQAPPSEMHPADKLVLKACAFGGLVLLAIGALA